MDANPSENEQATTHIQHISIDITNDNRQEKGIQQNECSNKNHKPIGEKKLCVNFDEKVKVEHCDVEYTELLGSVTTHTCPGTRTSARVIQKMKQDQTRPLTPPPNERDLRRDERNTQKTPNQVRINKPTWTNLERNHFFDALNEFGKDFESIGNYINSKLKRKSTTDVSFKTKDQVRQHYYQTCHKICKYIKFSDEVKKPVQELYALINYGEMRRKLQFVTEKHFMKLRSLVYQGYITVRCKGKNIRIKTPSCKALRRLNQLDDSLEDIRLPTKIEVMVSPANMESFGRVQIIAQNPRVRTTVPLHKKLVNFIKAFQCKWRSSEMKLGEDAMKLFPTQLVVEQNGHIQSDAVNQSEKSISPPQEDAEMCFLPKPGVVIHRPLLSITEYLSSVNICLTAYEERMGIKLRGETLGQERNVTKRQRTESGSEKRSPETKKVKQISSPVYEKDEEIVVALETETLPLKSESSSDELSDEINELLSDTDILLKEETISVEVLKGETTSSTTVSLHGNISSAQQVRTKRGSNAKITRSSLMFKPLLSEDVMRRIRKGWTVSNAADITIGDLYVVFGQDSKLELDYYWTDSPQATTTADALVTTDTESLVQIDSTSTFTQKQNGMPYNPSGCANPSLLNSLAASSVGNKLKHLLLIANLSERIRKRQCSCGHTCNASKNRIERDISAKTYVSTKKYASNGIDEINGCFRQPTVPFRRPIYNMDPVKQLATLTRQKGPRQVYVQRLLMPGGASSSYDLLDVKNLQNNFVNGSRNAEEFHTSDADANANANANTNANANENTNANANANENTNANANANENPSSQCLSPPTTIPSPPNDNCASSSSSNDQLPDIGAVVCDTYNFGTALDIARSETKIVDGKIRRDDVNEAKNDNNNCDSTNATTPLSLPDSAYDDCSNTSMFTTMSPTHLLRDTSSNSRWLEENLNDFSLTSLLGHLDEINGNRDILDPVSNLSVISESSVDYRHKFQEITALMQNIDKDHGYNEN